MAPSTSVLERARRVHDLAREDPARIDIDDITDVISSGEISSEAHSVVLRTVRLLVNERPAVTPRLVAALSTALESDTTPDSLVLRCLREVARADPDSVSDLSGAVSGRFDAPALETRRAATACGAEIAAVDPSAFVDAVPTLATLLAEVDETVREGSVFILAKVAHEYPEEVRPVVPQLLTDLGDQPESFQTCALSTVGAIASLYPMVGRDATDTFADLARTGSPMVQTNAYGLLADVAQTHPDAVAPHGPVLRDGLESDETLVVRNAATAIANVGTAATDVIPGLLECLDHADRIVRRNSARALGQLEATVALEQLRRTATEDPDEEVRSVATWSLEQVRTD